MTSFKDSKIVKNKFSLSQIYYAIAIIAAILTAVYFPVKAELKAYAKDVEEIRKEIIVLKEEHNKHCKEQKERFQQYALLGETNIKLDQICIDLGRLFNELDRCREKDEQLRDAIQALIIKMP